jgi:nucleotide-binding universal stress UspA family protein
MSGTQATQPRDGRAGGVSALAFSDILCAVDGKRGGFAAVEQAASLAAPGAHLTLLAVTSFRSMGEHRGPALGPLETKGILDRAMGIAREARVPSAAEVDPAAPPSQVVLDWSAQRDLLAMGAPATSRLGGIFIAGVADTALGAFTTPLLAARDPAGEHPFAHRILVASDGLEGSDALVQLAGQLALRRGARVILLHASGHEPRGSQERIAEQERRLGLATADDASELRVESGSPHAAIVETAKAVGASLVVMGSRRLHGLRAMGSVSRHVVHEAGCSVLLVPPERLHG